jgi:BirA family biotin operon repressor/biotin-[acetyl-CoA-carboxylase] ligase
LDQPLPTGYRVRRLDSVDSTNEVALEIARQGEAGYLWVVAREQTAGRGRRGRAWSSPPGNLYASLLLVDAADTSDATGTISLAAAVALHVALVDAAGGAAASRLLLKWPNDVLCDGQKVAGILVEGSNLGDGRRALVIGMGVNCLSNPPVTGAHPASNLAALGYDVRPDMLFAHLAQRMAEELERWDGGRNFDSIRERWLARSAGVGAPVRVALPGGDVEGAFETVDSAGRLVVRQPDGSVRAVSSGDASMRFSSGAR